ncbi:SCO6880 family protein [Streptomyces sp. L7]
MAVLLHADRRTVTAAIEIEGPGVGLRDSEDQEALVDRFGTLLKHVANGDGFVTRLQMLARTLSRRPGRPRQGRRPARRREVPDLAPAVVRPTAVDGVHQQRAAPRLPRRVHALQPRTLSRGPRDGPRLARPRRAARLDRDAGLAVVMARELTDICSRLQEADIRVRQPLGQGRLASLIHSMYDPDHPIDHIQAMTKRNAWPAELDAMEPTFLQAKTRESSTREPWCHATAWVKEWPMTPWASTSSPRSWSTPRT